MNERIEPEAFKFIFPEGVYRIEGEDERTEGREDGGRRTGDGGRKDEKTEGREDGKREGRGDERKEVLIVTEIEPQGSTRELLDKILGAVGYSLDTVDIKPTPDDSYEKMIVFGKSGSHTHLNKYQVNQEEACKVIICDQLETIEQDVSLKRQLWDCLKKMF